MLFFFFFLFFLSLLVFLSSLWEEGGRGRRRVCAARFSGGLLGKDITARWTDFAAVLLYACSESLTWGWRSSSSPPHWGHPHTSIDLASSPVSTPAPLLGKGGWLGSGGVAHTLVQLLVVVVNPTLGLQLTSANFKLWRLTGGSRAKLRSVAVAARLACVGHCPVELCSTR